MLHRPNLIELYKDYLNYQDNFEGSEYLLYRIISANAQEIKTVTQSDELYHQCLNYKNNNFTEYNKKRTNSSGSTGPAKIYYMLCAHQLEQQIETINKKQSINKTGIRIVPDFALKNQGINRVIFNDIFYNFKHVVSIRNDDIEQIIQTLKNIPGSQKVFYSTSVFFLYANSYPQFRRYLINSDSVIVSSDYSSFYKKHELIANGVQVNDCMIDWASGQNFYHCKYQSTHLLPIFVKIDNKVINLLNLYKNNFSNVGDDLFNIKGYKLCGCGNTAVDLDFIPHHKYTNKFYNTKDLLAETLVGHYYNFQIIDNYGSLRCCYVCKGKMPLQDKRTIIDMYGDLDFYTSTKIYTSNERRKLEPFYFNKDNRAMSFVF